MKIHTEVKNEAEDQKTFQIEVEVPKSDQPIVPGEISNKNISQALHELESQIMEHKWLEEMGYEEKIEVLRQYCLYWFLNNILQIDYYPLPKSSGSSETNSG